MIFPGQTVAKIKRLMREAFSREFYIDLDGVRSIVRETASRPCL
jgi:hypothetical protein